MQFPPSSSDLFHYYNTCTVGGSGQKLYGLEYTSISIEEREREIGRNPVSKHQIQPEYGDDQPDAGRDG